MGTKSPGARGVPQPNNAGGVGDPSGVIMLDRFVNNQVYQFTGTTERAVLESRAVVDTVDEENAHAGH
jgi:hypothetical protein